MEIELCSYSSAYFMVSSAYSRVYFIPETLQHSFSLFSGYKTLNPGLIKIVGLKFVLEEMFHSFLRYNF